MRGRKRVLIAVSVAGALAAPVSAAAAVHSGVEGDPVDVQAARSGAPAPDVSEVRVRYDDAGALQVVVTLQRSVPGWAFAVRVVGGGLGDDGLCAASPSWRITFPLRGGAVALADMPETVGSINGPVAADPGDHRYVATFTAPGLAGRDYGCATGGAVYQEGTFPRCFGAPAGTACADFATDYPDVLAPFALSGSEPLEPAQAPALGAAADAPLTATGARGAAHLALAGRYVSFDLTRIDRSRCTAAGGGRYRCVVTWTRRPYRWTATVTVSGSARRSRATVDSVRRTRAPTPKPKRKPAQRTVNASR